jgi:hypothetical protein
MARRKSEATDGDDAAPDSAEAAAGSTPEVQAEPEATEPLAEFETAAEVPLDEYHEEPHEEGGR